MKKKKKKKQPFLLLRLKCLLNNLKLFQVVVFLLFLYIPSIVIGEMWQCKLYNGRLWGEMELH